jgi:hypothetical protein
MTNTLTYWSNSSVTNNVKLKTAPWIRRAYYETFNAAIN